jgi:hypothetical protein
MRLRWLAVFPVVWGGAFLALDAAFSGTSGYGVFLRTEIELVKVLALFGSWAAALAFERGEYLRRAWLFVGGAFACFLLRDLTLAPLGFEAMGEGPLVALRGALSVLGNASQVYGTWLLARAWKEGGLVLPGERSRQSLVLFAAIALALVFAGPAVLQHGRAVLDGRWESLALFASAIGDTLSLCLIAPLFLTATALHGGLLEWPWGLLVASSVAWLIYDGVHVYGPMFGLGPDAVRTAAELFRALGCTWGFAAGMAQRSIVQRLRGLVAQGAPASGAHSRAGGAVS